jgi:UDP-N-acetylmuramyl pentapeptide phosphotransferase/UDP-N-acetylglucosamine-1-phosphate transferase
MGFAVPLTLFAAMLCVALVGFADDIRPIPVLPRLALQAAAVGAVLLTSPADLRVFPACPIEIERGLLLIAGLWFVNLVNFMDGLDLMTVAEAVPIAGAMMLLGWLGAVPTLPAIIAAALCGAMLGFAPFNRPVARVFLGDVGSLPIGLLLGWLLLQLAWQHHLVAALLLPLYYLMDATVTLLRRMARREPFWAAHRTHFYQRATDRGFTVREVIGEVLALNAVLAALALATVLLDSTTVNVVALLAGTTAVVFRLRRFSQPRSS